MSVTADGSVLPLAIVANVLYTVVHVCQLAALAITWSRFWKGGRRVSQASDDTSGTNASIKSSSRRSKENAKEGASSDARQGVQRFRLLLTNGMAVAATPRMVDAYALYFKEWFLLNIVGFYVFCMFGAVWFLHLVKQYIKALYAAERDMAFPRAAQTVYFAFAIAFVCVLSTWTIGLIVTEHLGFVFGNYVGSVVCVGAMGVAIHFASKSIYERIEQMARSSPSANPKLEREREERVTKFKKFAKSAVGTSAQIVVTNIVSAAIFFPQGDVVRLDDLEPWKVIFLDVQLTLCTQGMMAFVQYLQWIPKPKPSVEGDETEV